MRDLQSLISDLESRNVALRNSAALQLMDIGDAAAVAPLLNAIDNPENVNHRGTLVYALSAFDCEPYVEALVDLSLTGNFEVSASAFSIIENLEMSKDLASRMGACLAKYASVDVGAEHHRTAFDALSEFLRREA
jgi:HEAT repeat protein